MPEDPYDNDLPHESFDDNAYAAGRDDTQPPPHQSPPSSSVVYCTNCGVQLHGLSIGEPCTNCRVPVGTAGNLGGKTNGMAITSMVLGICSIPVCMCYGIFSIIIGIVGVVIGSIATKQIDSGGYSNSSKGMATAGKICSWVGIGLGVTYILFIVVIIIIAESNP